MAVWQIVQLRYLTFAWLWKLGAFGAACSLIALWHSKQS
jgi:hypothetical protein